MYVVDDVNEKLRKVLEIIVVILIIALSVVIFLMRNKIQNVSSFGYFGIFLLCFLANATVMLPAPSLMIAASCALIMNPILVAIFAALGSATGEFVGYVFGTVTKDLSPKFKKILDKLTEKVHNENLLIFIFAVLPLPLFDVVGIYSGGTKTNLLKFFLICFVGKLIKTLIYVNMYDILAWLTGLISNLYGIDITSKIGELLWVQQG